MKTQYKKFVVNSLVVALTASMLVACGSNDSERSPFTQDIDNKNSTPTPQPTPTPVNEATLLNKIVDEDGNPLVGATVSVAGKSQQTNTMGQSQITLSNISSDKMVVLLIKKAGYLTTAKEVLIKPSKTTKIDIKLFKDQIATNFESSTGTKVENPEKTASVDIPENAIVDADGNAYNGQVKLAMSYYSPEDMKGVQAFAQPYVGIQENNAGNTDLISVGVIEVKLTDQNNEPLQLKDGSQATITLPANSVSEERNSIPLWHYDEDKKIWVEEGVANKQADGSYQGKVSHFTLWNLDIAIGSQQALLKGCFEDLQGNKLNSISARITATGWSNYGLTSDGTFEVYVPANLPLTLYPNIGESVAIPIPELAVNEIRDNTNTCYVVKKVASDDGLSYTFEVEVPPVARDNYKSALQNQKIMGNVITDIDGVDTDGNGDSLVVVSYTLDTDGNGQPEPFTQGQTATISNIGQFSIDSDGSYEFIPINNYTGDVPDINYRITDGKQGFANATLSLEIHQPNDGAVAGTHILGYRVVPLIDSTKLNSTDPLSMVQDLVTMTLYVDDGKFSYKYETLKGTPIPKYLTEAYNSTSYTLTDKALTQEKYTLYNNIYSSLSSIVTKIDASSYQSYWLDDKELTVKVDLGKQSIADQNIQSMMNISPDGLKKIYNAIEQLPENERVFANSEQCTYISGITNSKPSIDFSVENSAAGSDTMDDLNSQSDEWLSNPISGTWAGIPWIASANVDSEGLSEALVLYNGHIVKSSNGYNQAGTFTINFDECDWYNKSQVDFTINAMKKTFPQLR